MSENTMLENALNQYKTFEETFCTNAIELSQVIDYISKKLDMVYFVVEKYHGGYYVKNMKNFR